MNKKMPSLEYILKLYETWKRIIYHQNFYISLISNAHKIKLQY